MKKLLSALIFIILLFSLCACVDDGDAQEPGIDRPAPNPSVGSTLYDIESLKAYLNSSFNPLIPNTEGLKYVNSPDSENGVFLSSHYYVSHSKKGEDNSAQFSFINWQTTELYDKLFDEEAKAVLSESQSLPRSDLDFTIDFYATFGRVKLAQFSNILTDLLYLNSFNYEGYLQYLFDDDDDTKFENDCLSQKNDVFSDDKIDVSKVENHGITVPTAWEKECADNGHTRYLMGFSSLYRDGKFIIQFTVLAARKINENCYFVGIPVCDFIAEQDDEIFNTEIFSDFNDKIFPCAKAVCDKFFLNLAPLRD